MFTPNSLRLRTRGGFALVLTLMLVALMTVLIVAILTTVKTETSVSSANAAGQTSRQLADIAIQTVIAQVQAATTLGPDISWASQPGMIRCYDSEAKEAKWYKLYSAQTMVQKDPGDAGLTLMRQDLPAGEWLARGSAGYGLYTDMNSPVLSRDGNTLVYPILDPAGAKSINSAKAVPGLDVDLGAAPAGYQASSAASPTNNPAAMPVRWLYVLRDGTLAAPEPGAAPGKLRVPGSHPRNNPVVGRIAFWTDDETCKLNINTAGDGTYFDSPRFAGAPPVSTPATEKQRLSDQQFAVTPPVGQEYQRFIGHPAQTRLSYVLPRVSFLPPTQRSRSLTQIGPFLQWGGSQGGTKTIWETNANLALSAPTRPTLFASLDEWMFSTTVTAGKRLRNSDLNNAELLSNDELERLRFLVSASSEAPELNLRGQPRIAIWPIHKDFLTNAESPYTTTLDRMIAQTATLNAALAQPQRYYFTRADSVSPVKDYTEIPRNQELFKYLRDLAAKPVPGYGASFNGKYGAPRMDQVLTEIFDYIRSTNPSDPMLLKSGTGTDYSYAKSRKEERSHQYEANPYYVYPGRGQVTPIYMADYGTKGFGRFFSISEVSFDFTKVKTATIDGKQVTTYVGFLNLGLFSPSLGPGNLYPNLRVEIAGLEEMKVRAGASTNPIFAPPSAHGRAVYSAIPRAARWHAGNRHPFLWGGAIGPRPLFVAKNPAYWTGSNTPSVAPESYAFCGKPFTAEPTDKLSVQPASLTIRVYHANLPDNATATNKTYGDGVAGTEEFLVQELKVDFPGFTDLPMPTNAQKEFKYRISNASINEDASDQQPYLPGDVIRSMVGAYNGDFRLLAAMRNVPVEGFVKHPKFDTTDGAAHSLRDVFPAQNFIATGFSPSGTLVSAAEYAAAAQPVTGFVDPGNTAQAPELTGDWDTGIGAFPDGPYINKPDEVELQYFFYESWLGKSSYPYFKQGDIGDVSKALVYSSPNRTIASPVAFGSLPTGVPIGGLPAVPWRTLLFRPQANHFGATTPKDSLLLDWFWMPIVEPYAVSTPFATAGKVNLNYQIAPFTYIKRATALMGVLGSECVVAVPTADGKKYKDHWLAADKAPSYRFPVRVLEDDGLTAAEKDGSLRQFNERFAKGEIFRSAADICDIFLVPGKREGETVASTAWTSNTAAETFWSNHKLTGDNVKERPYNGLYPRLTTKSNTYTVHVRAQVVRMPATGDAEVWVESPDRVVSEYRGSAIVNRYIDPEETALPDFANPAKAGETLEKFYKYRVLEARRFLP
jgi:uncharacterized protein (TIGR02600 family)